MYYPITNRGRGDIFKDSQKYTESAQKTQKTMADSKATLESAIFIFRGPAPRRELHHSSGRHRRSCRLLLRNIHDTAFGGQEHSGD